MVGVTVIIGVGSTVMVKFCAGPGQPFAVGVTVKLPAIGAVPVFVAVNEPMEPPLPELLMPILKLLFVQV